MKIFDEATRALKTLMPRYMKPTPAMMVGPRRVKIIKRKITEENDIEIVDNFLKRIKRQEEDNAHVMNVDLPRPC